MAYSIMQTYIFFALFIAFSPIFGFSLLTGRDSQNSTYSEETVREVKNFDVLRQLLNQETLIRMSMAKDMLSLKQSFLGEVSTLKQTTAELKKDLLKLERENERLSNENVKCNENVNLVLGNSDEMNKTIDKLRDELKQSQQNLSSAVSSLDVKISNNSHDISREVAFSASASSGRPSWNSGTLVFPVVITNQRNGYNPSNGIFTAPTNGNYVFFVNVQSYDRQNIYVDIVLNTSTKVRTMAYTGGSADTKAGTNLVVLTLQKGDKVWVKHNFGKGYYSNNGHITTFSGFLI